jgi:hypothetical protein
MPGIYVASINLRFDLVLDFGVFSTDASDVSISATRDRFDFDFFGLTPSMPS